MKKSLLSLIKKSLRIQRTASFYMKLIWRYQNWWQIIANKILSRPATYLRLRNGIEIFGNHQSQLVALADEIFFKKVYLRDKLTISAGDIVIDIGGNVGIFGLFSAMQGAGKLYIYEPFPGNIRLIKKNLKANVVSGAHVFSKAVSSKNSTARLYLDHHNTGHFIADGSTIGQFKESRQYIGVPTVTLETIIEQNQLRKVDFLKIDAEGSEGEIIKTTKSSVWKKIRQVAVEYHDNVSVLSHFKIEARLQQVGFKTEVVAWGDSEMGYIYAWR
jgi:FkbM family methyltransferase